MKQSRMTYLNKLQKLLIKNENKQLTWNSDELNDEKGECDEIDGNAGDSGHYHSPHLHVVNGFLKSEIQLLMILKLLKAV